MRTEDRALADAVRLGEELVDAWGSWAPTLSPDCTRIAFVSDRTGSPRLFVQDLPDSGADGAGGAALPEAREVALGDDPVVEVEWSADGGWLACALATGGGVRTQVWVVRPDGSDARRVAGSTTVHAELGPWTRSGHRLSVSVPGETAGEPTRAYLVDPASGEMYALATGELISVLDLSVDEDHVVLRDGQRGRQFCVVVDRVADADHPLLPYPATGSTDRAFVRPAPPGDPEPPGRPAGPPLIAYLATDAGLPRRQLVAIPLGPAGWRGQSGVLAPRPDAELEGLDADDAGRTLLCVWNVAGGRSELELVDAWTGTGEVVDGLPGAVVSGALLSRDGSTALVAVEGPERPRELWRLDVASRTWTLATARPAAPAARLVSPTLEFLHGRDGLPLTGWLYRPPGWTGPGPAVLSLHGGPEAQERPTFNPQHQAMAAAGIAVFAPNVRGSSGFGRAFVHADDVHGRRDAFDDVLACEDFLVRLGVAEPGRVAVTGRSYGGYLTLAMLAFHPGVFAGGVDICGMSDLHTFYRDTEPWIAAAAVTKYGDPARDWTLLRALSPMQRVENIDVPVLVVHGELDTNVPYGEATQVVDALRTLGRRVELLTLHGEGHEYRRASSRRRLLGAMLLFLDDVLDP